MKTVKAADVAACSAFFDVLASTEKSQVASMMIAPAKTSGEFGTEHPQSDQVLLVLAGEASVRVGDETLALKAGDLCVIEAGEPHQVRNSGLGPLRTLNVYAPAAYDQNGNPLDPA